MTIKYLGLNFSDLVVEYNTEVIICIFILFCPDYRFFLICEIQNEFGPLEYTGCIENNKMIMGISLFKKKSSEILYDPYFMWPVPSTWSLEDATTVPLSYAMVNKIQLNITNLI